MNGLRAVAVFTVTLFASLPAAAIVINTGSDADVLNRGYTTAGGVLVPPMFGGIDLSGVVQVSVGNRLCTGSLLPDGLSVLTAGHCVTASYGSDLWGAGNVNFLGPDGFVTTSVLSISVNPGWDGTGGHGGDLAVLRLDTYAPQFAARYSLYSGAPDFSSVNVLAGYGYGGTGETGYDGGAWPYGTLRAGTNKYVITGTPIGDSSRVLLGQVYNPNDSTTNVLQAFSPYFASDAATVAPGDSGGPTFRAGQLVGVHDTIGCFSAPNGTSCQNGSPDPNSSWGQFFEDTSVSANYAWINQQVVPEPSTIGLFLAGAALLGVGGLRRSRSFSKVHRAIRGRIFPGLNRS